MLIYVTIDKPVLPDWIYEKEYSDAALLEIWHRRAQIHANILNLEYLPSPSPWKVQYRAVNCSGRAYALT